MTTKVTVSANHGWPVDVTTVSTSTDSRTDTSRVAAGDTRDFYVHSGQDLLIH